MTMTQRRTTKLTLVLLGSGAILAAGCGDQRHQVDQQQIDNSVEAQNLLKERRKIEANTNACLVTDAAMEVANMMASGPVMGPASILTTASAANMLESGLDELSKEAKTGVIRGTSPSGSHTTTHRHYHSSGGGFFMGYMLGSLLSSRSPSYNQSQSAFTSRWGSGATSGGGVARAGGSSGSSGGRSGVVSGGFGSSGHSASSGGGS